MGSMYMRDIWMPSVVQLLLLLPRVLLWVNGEDTSWSSSLVRDLGHLAGDNVLDPTTPCRSDKHDFYRRSGANKL